MNFKNNFFVIFSLEYGLIQLLFINNRNYSRIIQNNRHIKTISYKPVVVVV